MMTTGPVYHFYGASGAAGRVVARVESTPFAPGCANEAGGRHTMRFVQRNDLWWLASLKLDEVSRGAPVRLRFATASLCSRAASEIHQAAAERGEHVAVERIGRRVIQLRRGPPAGE